jgi:hypothetical protein
MHPRLFQYCGPGKVGISSVELTPLLTYLQKIVLYSLQNGQLLNAAFIHVKQWDLGPRLDKNKQRFTPDDMVELVKVCPPPPPSDHLS